MKRIMISGCFALMALLVPDGTAAEKGGGGGKLLIGWASADLTPDKPVIIAGQMYAKVSTGVLDQVTATVLALESKSRNGRNGQAVLVSCDLVSIPDGFRDAVREKCLQAVPELDPMNIVMNATHTHTAPLVKKESWQGMDIDLGVTKTDDYIAFAAGNIAKAVATAWNGKEPGGISYALGYAAVGHNRLMVNHDGVSTMYAKTDNPDFSHFEGSEDHSVNILATWNADRKLTGMIVNLACPAQLTESLYQISADYWHETRIELRKRHGERLFILPQCSAAGDQTPRTVINKAVEAHMSKVTGESPRQVIAVRISDAITSAMPVLKQTIEFAPVLAHHVESVALTRRVITADETAAAASAGKAFRAEYEKEKALLKSNHALRNKPHWYIPVSKAFMLATREEKVAAHEELEKKEPRYPAEVHILRLGDTAFATNPFEYYLDYGLQIKARSKAVQTFVVQLAGGGSYVPTVRAVAGKGYGAVPTSTIVGPEGGRELSLRTVELINEFWK